MIEYLFMRLIKIHGYIFPDDDLSIYVEIVQHKSKKIGQIFILRSFHDFTN